MTIDELITWASQFDRTWKVIVADFNETAGTWHLREASLSNSQVIGVTPTGLEPNDYNADEPGLQNAVIITY